MSKVVTVVRPLRAGGAGLAGTIARAKHHGLKLLPFINAMKGPVRHLGFAEWRQGQTVHEFETIDGRVYTLRGLVRDDEYVGVRLALRPGKSVEYRLLDIDKVEDVPSLLIFMKLAAQPMLGDHSALQCN